MAREVFLICVVPPILLGLSIYLLVTRRFLAVVPALLIPVPFLVLYSDMGCNYGAGYTLFLSFGAPLLFLVAGLILWRMRQPGAGALVAGIGVITLALFASVDSVSLLMETLRGETTPQARVEAYLKAIAKGDERAALAMWPPNERLGPDYDERRLAITEKLLALGDDLAYRILDAEWWSTCCEPHVVNDPRLAGFARIKTLINGEVYVFDVLATKGRGCWGMGGHRWGWRIVDIYPLFGKPLYWTFPSPNPILPRPNVWLRTYEVLTFTLSTTPPPFLFIHEGKLVKQIRSNYSELIAELPKAREVLDAILADGC